MYSQKYTSHHTSLRNTLMCCSLLVAFVPIGAFPVGASLCVQTICNLLHTHCTAPRQQQHVHQEIESIMHGISTAHCCVARYTVTNTADMDEQCLLTM